MSSSYRIAFYCPDPIVGERWLLAAQIRDGSGATTLVAVPTAMPHPHGAVVALLLENLEREGFGADTGTAGPHLIVGPERAIPNGAEGGPVSWVRKLLGLPVPLTGADIEHGARVAERLRKGAP